MKITKQWEAPRPPLATGVTIELDMGEAFRLKEDLGRVPGTPDVLQLYRALSRQFSV